MREIIRRTIENRVVAEAEYGVDLGPIRARDIEMEVEIYEAQDPLADDGQKAEAET